MRKNVHVPTGTNVPLERVASISMEIAEPPPEELAIVVMDPKVVRSVIAPDQITRSFPSVAVFTELTTIRNAKLLQLELPENAAPGVQVTVHVPAPTDWLNTTRPLCDSE